MKYILWLAVMRFLPSFALPQTIAANSEFGALMSLQIAPLGLEKGFPVSFAFTLVNRTDHELRVPTPSVQCSDSYSGDIWLRMHFVPLNPAPSQGRSCAADRYQWPSILERAQEWRVLRPGESLTLRDDLHGLHMEDFKPGTYDLWAEYTPPAISSEDIGKLKAAGISIARVAGPSNHLSYVKRP